ncbi:hypothetical protein GCM10009548_12690 [Streptomyces malaysiensis subsp. malaysiensis]
MARQPRPDDQRFSLKSPATDRTPISTPISTPTPTPTSDTDHPGRNPEATPTGHHPKKHVRFISIPPDIDSLEPTMWRAPQDPRCTPPAVSAHLTKWGRVSHGGFA